MQKSTMNNEELDLLAKKIADRIQENSRQVKPILIRRKDISIMLGNAERSTSTNSIINDPTFPPSIELSDGGVQRWRYSDVKEWIYNHFERISKLTMQAHRLTS